MKRSPAIKLFACFVLIICMCFSMSLLVFAQDVPVDAEHFPDENFRNFVIELCNGTTLTESIINNTETIDLFNSNYGNDIKSLKGIEYFTNLRNLYASGLNLEDVSLSQNAALGYADLSYNQKIKALTFPDNIESLNLDSCNLKTLDITNLTKLRTLSLNSNDLWSLDTSQNTELIDGFGYWDESMFAEMNYGRILFCFEQNDGTYLVDFSKTPGWDSTNPGKYSVLDYNREEWSNTYDTDVPTITSRGIEFYSDPLPAGWTSMDFYLRYDLTNNHQLNGKYLYMPVRILRGSSASGKKIEINEDNFPDEGFRKYLIDCYNPDMSGTYPVIDAGIVTDISIDGGNGGNDYSDISSLSGIELFSGLNSISLYHLQKLESIDLTQNKELTSVYFFDDALYKVDIDPEIEAYVSLDGGPTETATENGGIYTLQLPDYIDFSGGRIFDCSEDVVDGTVTWESIDDVPRRMSYCYMLKEDYETGKDYEVGKDYVQINISLTNKELNLPAGQNIQLNATNFPDKNFRTFLAQNYGGGKNAKTINTAKVDSISLWNDGNNTVENLKGIELLTNLQYLSLSGLPISEIDLSHNSYLIAIEIWGAPLTSIDVSGCSILETLKVESASLHTLNVENNRALRTLSIPGSTLTELDLGNNRSLNYLNLNNNALKSLDYSSNKFRYFDVGNGDYSGVGNNRLKKLDLSKLTKVETFNIKGNSISDFGIEGGFSLAEMPRLTNLYIDGQRGNIDGVDLRNNNNIATLSVSRGEETESFYVFADFPSMTRLRWVELNGVSLSERDEEVDIDLRNSANLNSFSINYLQQDIGSLSLNGLRNLSYVYCCSDFSRDYEGNMSGHVIRNVDVGNCIFLTGLNLWNNGMEQLNISGDKSLVELDCSYNNLETLDITGVPALQVVNCNDNRLESLDTSKNLALKRIECGNNPIRSLDLTNNKGVLEALNCNNGSLTSLDVSDNSELKKDELNVSDQVLELENREVETLSENYASQRARIFSESNKGKLINLSKFGKFDKSKVSDLSAGKLTDKGILFEDGNVPQELSYKYDIRNDFKLRNVDPMNVTIRLVENKNPDDDNNNNNGAQSGDSGNDISDPYAPLHDSDGGGKGFGSVSSKNAKWVFDPARSNTVVAVNKLDISKAFDKYVSMNGFDSSAKHKYSVDNKKLAVVNKKGILKPKKRGEINIYLWQKQKGGAWTKFDTPVHFYLQVPEMQKKETRSMSNGDKIDAFMYLSCTTYRPTRWESTNPSVASIDDNGVITPHKKGSTKIIAVYGDGNQSSKKKYKTSLKIN